VGFDRWQWGLGNAVGVCVVQIGEEGCGYWVSEGVEMVGAGVDAVWVS